MKHYIFKLLLPLCIWASSTLQAQTCTEPAPAAINIVAATPTTLTVEWTPTAADLYEIKAVDIATGLEVYSAMDGDNIHTVTGLSPDKDYEVCVKPACSALDVSCNAACTQAHTPIIIVDVVIMSQQPPQPSGVLSAAAAGSQSNARSSLRFQDFCDNKFKFEVTDRGVAVAEFRMNFPALGGGCSEIKLDNGNLTLSNLTNTSFRLTSATGWAIDFTNVEVQANIVTFEYAIANLPSRNFTVNVLSNTP